MQNENLFPLYAFKLYGLNIPTKYNYNKSKNILINNLIKTEKNSKDKKSRNFNYNNFNVGMKTGVSGSRNTSALTTKYRNYYSLLYFNNQIKSIERDLGIINKKTKNNDLELNCLNIKKIRMPLNYVKITFDMYNKNNFREEKSHNNVTYYNNKEAKTNITNFNPKRKDIINKMKNSPHMSHHNSIKNFSNIQYEKDNKYKSNQKLESISKIKKNKTDISPKNIDKIFSITPSKPLNNLNKNFFFQTFDGKDFLQITKKNDNIKDENKLSIIKDRKAEHNKSLKYPTRVKSRNIELKQNLKKFNSHSFYAFPPMNYYKDNIYYYSIYPSNCGWIIKDCFKHRINWRKCHCNNTNLYNFKWKEAINSNDEFLELSSKKKQIINHFQYHSCLSIKSNMFYNFAGYCEENNINAFQYLPFTIILDITNYSLFYSYRQSFKEIFHNIEDFLFDFESIKNKIYDKKKITYKTLFPYSNPKFGMKLYCEISKDHYDGKNLWVVKVPNLNRGKGIKIFNNFNDIFSYIKRICEGKITESELYNINDKGTIEKNNNSDEPNICEKSDNYHHNINDEQDITYQSSQIIIQKYIEKPFLYNGRKFDIRIWVLITHKMNVYIFKEGHLKLSSVTYDKNNFDSFIHITNYSFQKYSKSFSKYEKGNEISFQIFQNYINQTNQKFNFKEEIFPKFIEIVKYSTLSAKNKININNINHCFEIFGYDFMLCDNKNVYLIEINTNPGLEISSDIIAELVPRMIDDALLLTVDDLFHTEYSEECLNENGQFKSKFHVKGYNDDENMWEFVCDMKKNNEKKIVNFSAFPPKRNKIKIKRMKK